MKTGIIVGAAPLGSSSVYLKKLIENKNDLFVIAADGGIQFFIENGISPDKWIGDMDSADGTLISVVNKKLGNVDVETCSPIKDETDMAIGLKILMEMGCDKAYLFGGMGGSRLDHSLANIALLHEYAAMNKYVEIVSDNCTMIAIHSDGEKKDIHLKKRTGKEKEYVSVFSLSDISKNVEINGLFYKYSGSLENRKALGVSNEFSEDEATIALTDGTLLIVQDAEWI